MDHGVTPSNYKDLVLFLATAGVIVPIFKRYKISPILGFLGAGVILGPYGLGAAAKSVPLLALLTISNQADIAEIAEFGVVFLLFMIGLELSLERLRLLRRLVFGLGGAQTVLSALVLGLVAAAFGQPPAAAAVIGMALALSSTAIIVPALAERRRQHSDVGRAAFAVLLFQDLAVAPILVAVSLLKGHARLTGPDLVFALAPAIATPLLILAVGRAVLRPMLKSVARAKSQELFMAACLLVVVGAGLASAAAGQSMALGAFIAGLLLAETEFRHEAEVTIEPFKGLLLGLFFLSVGIGLDFERLLAHPIEILGGVAALVLFKALVTSVLVKASGRPIRRAVEVGLILSAGGEFAFVVMAQAMGSGLVHAEAGRSLVLIATLSMFAIPTLTRIGESVGRSSTHAAVLPVEPPGLATPEAGAASAPRVLVIGYGRVGLMVGDMLERHQIGWVAVDHDAKLVEAGRRRGHAVYFGDAARVEFLRKCGLDMAPAMVATMDNAEAVESLVAAARQARPDMVIVARARDARQAGRLYELGATEAVPETVEASLQLSEALLVDLGVPMGLVIASVHEKRDEIRKDLNRPEALGARVRRARDRRP
ncbi:MAG TPA: cation:proton antiporter [Caulobacteraceae bacterium]|nr:cation:proton antiporter [Caulobacteraceae bacterium]